AGQPGTTGDLLWPGRGAAVELGQDHRVYRDTAGDRRRHRVADRVRDRPGQDAGPGATGPVRAVQGPELQPDELDVVRAVGRAARPLPAAHHLPAVGARLLGAEGRSRDGAVVHHLDVRRARGRPPN